MSDWLIVIEDEPPKTTFAQRIKSATEHEQAVIDRMVSNGWKAQPWGQGLFTREVAAELRKTDSLVRWQPDALAVMAPGVIYIDAKAESRRTTENHSIENMAHRAHLTRMAAEAVPVVYVWPDWSAQVASRVVVDKVFAGRQRYQTSGSGTPYLLTKKAECVAFDDVLAEVSSEWPDWVREANAALARFDDMIRRAA